MTTLQKSVLAFFGLAALLGAVAFFGLSPFGKSVTQQVFGSPAGSTFSTAKIASVAINLAAPGTNGTSTSITNTDASDRYIISEEAGCEGVGTSQTAYTGTGLASLTITIATSTTANPTSNSNVNSLPVITIATSSVNFAISSSTAGTPGNGLVSNIWAAGTPLTFTSNATNTAKCSVGIRYLGA